MNLNALELLAQKLTNNRLGIKYKPESILTYMSQNSDNFKTTVKDLRDTLLSQLDLVKNGIIPFTKNLIQEFDNKLNNIDDPNPLFNHNIVMVEYPQAINHLVEDGYIGPIRDSRNISNYGIGLSFNEDNLDDYLNHPNPNVEEYVRNKVDGNESSVLSLLRDYFSNIGQSNDKIALLGHNVNKDKLEDFVLLHTILHNAKNIYNESPLEYQQAIGELYSEINNYMGIAKRNLDNLTNSGLMILGKNGNEYYVNSKLYDQYINEGHSSDAITGYLLNFNNDDYKSRYYSDLVKNQDKYISAFNSKMSELDYIGTNLLTAKYKSVYEIIFSNAINNIPDELQPYFNEKDNLIVDIKNYINSKQSDKVLNSIDIIHNVVGLFFFPTTAYFKFIKEAKSYEALNPNITPQEAATFSATDMLFDYILDQFELIEV